MGRPQEGEPDWPDDYLPDRLAEICKDHGYEFDRPVGRPPAAILKLLAGRAAAAAAARTDAPVWCLLTAEPVWQRCPIRRCV